MSDPAPDFLSRVLLAVLLCGLMLVGAGCEAVAPGSASAPPPDRSLAQTQLAGLKVDKWHSMAGYSRDQFPHWSSQGNDCDTRDVVLQRDGKGVAVADNCKITAGDWFSVYDSKTFSDPGDLDVDHMVPLAAAWRTGADKWTKAQRGDFANDLDRPQLIAVSASSNRSKGDQDPSQWKPPNRGYWCEYAADWIAVKAHWKLFVTADEKAALTDMLATC